VLKIVENLWAVGAPLRTPLGSSQRSPDPLAGGRGLLPHPALDLRPRFSALQSFAPPPHEKSWAVTRPWLYLSWFKPVSVVRVWTVRPVMASSSSVSNPGSAHALGHASYGVSVAGMVIGILVMIIVIAVVYSDRDSTRSTYYSSGSRCSYYYYGSTCYRRRYSTYSSYRCGGYYYRSYCYYNR